MIRVRLRALRVSKEDQERRKLSYKVIALETGLSYRTIAQLSANKSTGIAFATLETLCRYFHCRPSDLLELTDDQGNQGRH